jgi:hypothetical protein
MEEFSLYVLDITMNSVRAGADKIDISLVEKEGVLTFTVTDNGCGMTAEQVEKLSDPFFTTRKTRAVGLGIPFLRMLSMMTEGDVKITSRDRENHPGDHGTTVTATFGCDHIDFIPMGDLTGTVVTLIQGAPDVDFTYSHKRENGEVRLACSEIREVLGGEISLSEPEILNWIRSYLSEQYEMLK